MSNQHAQMRWNPYSLSQDGDFDVFWEGHLKRERRTILLIIGRGFDIRALEVARRLHGLNADITAWSLAFNNGQEDSERRKSRTDVNQAGLIDLIGRERVQEVDINITGGFSPGSTSSATLSSLMTAGDLLAFTDVVVDMSAMPTMVSMTSVAYILKKLDEVFSNGGANINLHVTVAESVSADNGARQGSLRDQVSFVRGFSGQLTSQTTQNIPHVWFPVLGESQRERLDQIRQEVRPDEICPVVPFPSKSPRRGDEIINEHREILFDTFQIEPKNILLACEYNPFEAYRQIFEAMDRYRRALDELGGCKAFVSPLSSKLLSMAVLLACYDHLYCQPHIQNKMMVGIPYIETATYGDPSQEPGDGFELYSMWIRGEWEVV